jgi:hypothetical protein
MGFQEGDAIREPLALVLMRRPPLSERNPEAIVVATKGLEGDRAGIANIVERAADLDPVS